MSAPSFFAPDLGDKENDPASVGAPRVTVPNLIPSKENAVNIRSNTTAAAAAASDPSTLPGAVFALDATIWRAQHLAQAVSYLVAGATMRPTDYQGQRVCMLNENTVEVIGFLVNDLEDVCDKAAMQQETAMLLARGAA